MSYERFLARKTTAPPTWGREPDPIPDYLYPFQRDVVSWAIRRGRAAIFCDTGLGKTRQQIEWARQSRGDGRVLFVAPLAVAEQTIAEGARLGVEIAKVAAPTDAPFQISNYEKLHRFIGADYSAIVLDESSILKSLDGKTRTLLLTEFTSIPRRLCCTATPAPNDMTELANHAEFLGVMPRVEVLATFFVHDSEAAGAAGWRLKGHAQDAFWRWVAKWAAYVRRPSDLGYDDGAFQLPELRIRNESVSSDWKPDGMLFAVGIGGIGDRRDVRKRTLESRIRRTAEIVQSTPGQWLVWCDLNAEGDGIEELLGDECVQISGADTDEQKIAREAAWRRGDKRVLVTKPKIFGFGLNWQHCHQMAFVGLGDSYESYYQSIRRCWRYGQQHPVDVVIVTSDVEREVAENVRRKEDEAMRLAHGVSEHTREIMTAEIRGQDSARKDYREDIATGDGWTLYLGDCVARIREVPDASVGLSVFSPPFASLYTYSASDRDMGNSRDHGQFFEHFAHLIPELKRVTMPGRVCAVHCQQLTTTKATHGVIGWVDFRGDLIRAFQAHGWVYDGEVVIDKDPQAQAIRTKTKALMFAQLEKDSSWTRPAMADYILRFRHPGENTVAIKPELSREEWIKWARPIWYDIRESDTLNAAAARSEKDERHICPLQLETIERCLRLWSNRGETVLSPFAGIGSEGYVSLRHGRKFVGVELKPEYWRQAQANLASALRQLSLGGIV